MKIWEIPSARALVGGGDEPTPNRPNRTVDHHKPACPSRDKHKNTRGTSLEVKASSLPFTDFLVFGIWPRRHADGFETRIPRSKSLRQGKGTGQGRQG